jgi:putative oxidoreductase
MDRTSDGIRPILPFLAPVYAALAEPAYALTRFVAGAFLVPHGMWKLFGITGGSKEGMIEFFSRIGLEPAGLLVNLVGSVEFFGGILIALEFSGLWAVVLLLIAIRGGGRISLDALLGREF